MSGRIPARRVALVAAALATSAVMAVGASAAGAAIYNNIPSPLPGNFASIGFDATSTSQLGGEIQLAGIPKVNPKVKVEVVMSDWACESGSWNTENCSSPRHKSFKEPITVSLYEVGNLTTPIATATKNAKIPYRPSADPVHCSEFPGTWYDEATNECFNGIASSFTAKLRVTGKLPTTLIVTVSYPTGSGPSQSLNLAISEPSEHTLGLGSDPTQELFLDSSWSEMYCAGATDVGTFGGSEGNCWEGDQPVIAVHTN
jgi:hypothetical protein